MGSPGTEKEATIFSTGVENIVEIMAGSRKPWEGEVRLAFQLVETDTAFDECDVSELCRAATQATNTWELPCSCE